MKLYFDGPKNRGEGVYVLIKPGPIRREGGRGGVIVSKTGMAELPDKCSRCECGVACAVCIWCPLLREDLDLDADRPDDCPLVEVEPFDSWYDNENGPKEMPSKRLLIIKTGGDTP